jgi:hypothetical protein
VGDQKRKIMPVRSIFEMPKCQDIGIMMAELIFIHGGWISLIMNVHCTMETYHS